MPLRFDNSFARLPAPFHVRMAPAPVPDPKLIRFNGGLAAELGLAPGEWTDAEITAVFSGNKVPAGAEPLALAYAGHQFGQFVPQLGDGRAVLLGEVLCPGGRRLDIQLKGSGPTPFSRGGDGRAAVGPVIRELIVSEAMHALGIPTTRALAAVATGDPVFRERPYPGAVLTRVAASHLRIGSFEFLAARGDHAAVRQLADYAIARHYPGLAGTEGRYAAFLEKVLEAQARLVALWMGVGFIHGVMNTDNTTISGETIDYGPCAFLDRYEPGKVFSSIDRRGRYAYANQPLIAQWNLARLAECLLPLLAAGERRAHALAEGILASFPARFSAFRNELMARKLGLAAPRAEDAALVEDFLALLHRSGADFTNSFAHLAERLAGAPAGILPGGETLDPGLFAAWEARWRERLASAGLAQAAVEETLRSSNPLYIPRNHLIARAIEAAEEREDYGLMAELAEVLARPFERHPRHGDFVLPPRPEEAVQRTFCGT